MLIFAHRGASGTEPENTLLAFEAALLANADGIEIDIHQVEDKLMVIHDRWLHRTTSGKGQIFQHSYEHLRSLDAGLGEKIPTLDEVLNLIAGKCTINIELKGVEDIDLLFSYLDDALNNTVLTINEVLISSFDHRLLSKLHQQRPDFKIGALTACSPLEYAKFAAKLASFSVHIDVDFITEAFVQDAHHRGLKVYVYTVDEIEDINAMKALGVDGIFTNFPSRAKLHLKEISAS